MTDKKSRRGILQSAGGFTAFGAISNLSNRSEAKPQARIIEAGLRYEVPETEDVPMNFVNSRPPYTINKRERSVVLSEKLPETFVDSLSSAGHLVDESISGDGIASPISRGRQTMMLPSALTVRKRPARLHELAEPIRTPEVMVNWNNNSPVMTVEGRGRFDVEPDTTRTIELRPERVKLRTIQVLDELVEVAAIPREYRAKKQEEGEQAVSVTPVVEISDYGRLTIERGNF
jgi:hypothetical protein